MKKRSFQLFKVGLVLSMLITTQFPDIVHAKDTSHVNTEAISNVQQYNVQDGSQLTFTQGARLYVIATDKTLNNSALLDDLKLISSMFASTSIAKESLSITFGPKEKAKPYDIVIHMDDLSELKDKPQSYKMEIRDQVIITSASEIGLFYGMQTLLQMYIRNDNAVYKGDILDYPDSKERSMHLDIARKYFTMDWIKDLLKEMSYLKMNSLQLHFSENEGFRIQSDTLDAKGITYPSQYYSKEDITEIVKEAQKYHIDVIPSLDTPGHLRYILNQMPGYSLQGVINDGAASRTFNIFTNPEAKTFLLSLLDEFASFFSSLGCTRMNIGGDEFLDKFDVLTNDQYKKAMDYFNEASAAVKKYGMTPRAWNDGLRFGDYTGYTLDPDIEICYWSGGNNCASIEEFVQNGHKIMNYVDVYMYYVLASWWDQNANPQPNKIYNEWYPGRCSDLHHDGTVTPQKYEKPYPDFLLGTSLALWCDTPSYKNEDQIRDQLHYRLRVVGEKAWHTQENMPDYDSFKSKADKLGVTPGTIEELMEPGDVYQDSDMPSVTLLYEDMDHNRIAPDEIYYGVVDSPYQFEAKMIYGYQFKSASECLTGTYEGEKTIVMTYKLEADKHELRSLLSEYQSRDAYIPVSYQDYDQAFTEGSYTYADTKATQQQVDSAVHAIKEAISVLIPITKQGLYDVIDNAITSQHGYSDSSFKAYRAQIDAGKALLYQECTEQEILRSIGLIQTSKDNLTLGTALTISSSETPYQTNYPANAIDGNKKTMFWTNSDQQIGDYFLFTLRDASIINEISITQGYNGDSLTEDLIFGADILASENGQDWTKVGAIKKEHDLTVKLNQIPAKYIKFVITESSKNWIQLNEVSIQAESDPNAVSEAIRKAQELLPDDYTQYSYEQVQIALITLHDLIDTHADNEAIALAITNLNAAIDQLRAPLELNEVEPYTTSLQHPWIEAYGNVEFVDTQAILHHQDKVQWKLYGSAISLFGEGTLHVRILKENELIDEFDCTAKDDRFFTKAYERDLYTVMIENKDHLNSTVSNIVLPDGFLEVQEPIVETSILRDILLRTIQKANDIKENGLLDKVAEKVIENFENSLENATRIYADPNSSDEVLWGAWSNLAKSMQYLDFKADKTSLNILILEAKSLDLNDYKEDGKVEFKNALTYAEEIMASKDVLDMTIVKAYDRLLTAKDQLIRLDECDITVISYLIRNSDHIVINASYYEQDANWTAFISALDHAKTIVKNSKEQTVINQAAIALASAYENVRLIANEERLQEIQSIISRMKAMYLADYANEDVVQIQHAIAYGTSLLNRPFTYDELQYFMDLKEEIEGIITIKAPELSKTPNTSIEDNAIENSNTPSNIEPVNGVVTGDATQMVTAVFTLSLSGAYLCMRKRKKHS